MSLRRNMRIVDTNVILRYILADDDALSSQAKQIIDGDPFDVPIEVLAEVVYVLQKVYSVPRNEIAELLQDFARDTEAVLFNENIVLKALDIYSETNMGFVDCILASCAEVAGAEIHTFDKQLASFIQKS